MTKREHQARQGFELFSRFSEKKKRHFKFNFSPESSQTLIARFVTCAYRSLPAKIKNGNTKVTPFLMIMALYARQRYQDKGLCNNSREVGTSTIRL